MAAKTIVKLESLKSLAPYRVDVFDFPQLLSDTNKYFCGAIRSHHWNTQVKGRLDLTGFQYQIRFNGYLGSWEYRDRYSTKESDYKAFDPKKYKASQIVFRNDALISDHVF